MAWTYSNWSSQTTAALRTSVLRSHVAEVADAIQSPQSVNSSSHGMSKHDLVTLHKNLLTELATRERASRTAGGVTRLRIRR